MPSPCSGGALLRSGGPKACVRSHRCGEHRGEPLYPPVHRDVVDDDAPLGQQLLDVSVGQPVAQVPADRDRDHLGREPEPGERRPLEGWSGGSRSTRPPASSGRPGRHRPGSTNATDPNPMRRWSRTKRPDVWDEIATALGRFETADGFVGPCELLVASARAQPVRRAPPGRRFGSAWRGWAGRIPPRSGCRTGHGVRRSRRRPELRGGLPGRGKLR